MQAFTVDEIAQVIADAIESDEDTNDTIDITGNGISCTRWYGREAQADFVVAVDAVDGPQRFLIAVTEVTD